MSFILHLRVTVDYEQISYSIKKMAARWKIIHKARSKHEIQWMQRNHQARRCRWFVALTLTVNWHCVLTTVKLSFDDSLDVHAILLCYCYVVLFDKAEMNWRTNIFGPAFASFSSDVSLPFYKSLLQIMGLKESIVLGRFVCCCKVVIVHDISNSFGCSCIILWYLICLIHHVIIGSCANLIAGLETLPVHE